MKKLIVVGGGLAGLAAAVTAASEGAEVTVYEAARQAGGRCRSYYDDAFGAVIDNGNHLVLSGNTAVASYLKTIGAKNALVGPERAEFEFGDLATGARWTLRPNEGPLAWWIFSESRRVPGTKPLDYVKLAALLAAGPNATIEDLIPCEGPLWERLMRPFLVAVMNTEPEKSSARLAGAVLKETLAKGGRTYRPRIAHPTLAAAFVEPALKYLSDKRGMIHLGQRLRKIVIEDGRVTALEFPENRVAVEEDTSVVLAVPAWVAKDLLPGLTVPDDFRSIVNAHFKVPAPQGAPAMLGLINSAAEWVFTFPDRISVTVSAAESIVDRDREDLARLLWGDVAEALGLSTELPQWQIVKEKRATFAATPEQNALRPGTKTAYRNLTLAGDWTATGLPSTIEGALRSGQKAALALRS
ncbi:squalene-associated FAD-dependent desaturase [Rhizomicrobium palustre]|uniref:Squalene-associated FAD-dependent desaturase n=1 Tax=Rhizomicrobium palustre TaxID=189966 RepID=A0A846MZX6_9PROT|nr:hydroxysqualene dehydroxylase HpnE [Rhizomicrobium palustre]NIK88799.1 squalene-associated FAD-dependent desaturase [Rhizomicrobium palustre]